MSIGPESRPPEMRRRRLRFRSWHRGTREADLLLGSFADRYLDSLTDEQLMRYEALLEFGDPDIFDWVSGRATPPASVRSDVLKLLIEHRFAPPSH